MSFITLDIPPGVKRAGTQRESRGRWYDSHLMRWYSGAMGPIGGWVARTTTPMTGKCRSLLAWRDSDNVRWIGAGTHSKLYVATQTTTAPSDITPAGFTAGTADASASGGYGTGTYGTGTYGTPRIDNATVQEAGVWTLDTWVNDDLLACMRTDGIIYRWQRDTGVVAAALGGTTPVGNEAFIVTPEGFLMLLGAGADKRKVQWADQASLSDWTASATNQAGDTQLQTQGGARCGLRLRTQTLIFTELDVHAATYVGLPSVYRIDRVGESCGIVSRGAMAASGAFAFWMGLNGFFVYDGSVREIPCEVYEAVFGDMNTTQRSKITATVMGQYSEIWWLYPSAASTENDRYVKYNYLENHWDIGALARLAACDRGVFVNPIMADADGYLYDHETGSVYTGASDPYAESGPLEIGDGENIAKVREMVIDEKTQGDVEVTFYARDWPNGAETTFGPYTPANPAQIRFAARQAKMRVTGDVATAWRWGAPRLDVVAGGRR